MLLADIKDAVAMGNGQHLYNFEETVAGTFLF